LRAIFEECSMSCRNLSSGLAIALLARAALAQSGADPRFSLVDERTHATTSFSDTTLRAQPFLGPLDLVARPVRVAGRAAADVLDPSLPQRVDVSGVPAVRLGDGGLLVRFHDATRSESGLLHVAPDGTTRVLLARPDVGGRDALLATIGVSAVERRAALVEDENVTGRADVWLVRFDGGTFAATGTAACCVTAGAAVPDASAPSLAFARGSLWFVDNDATLLRAPTDGSADAAAVALPPSAGQAPATLSGEIAVSADGSTLTFLAGHDEKSWDLYVADAAGTATNLSQAAGQYPSIGQLPREPRGPFVSLSPDGSRVTYALEHPDFDLYTRRSDGSDLPQPLTEDSQFDGSIADGATVITFAARVLFSMGRTGTTHDFYRATLGAGGAALRNLTATSGSTTLPFAKGSTLAPACAARLAGAAATVFVNDRSVPLGRPDFELWIADASGSARHAADLGAVPTLVAGGPAAAPVTFALLVDAGGATLARLPASSAGSLDVLLRIPTGVRIDALAPSPDGGELALLADAGGGTGIVAVLDVSSHRPTRVLTPTHPPLSDSGSDQIAWSPSGRLLFTYGPATGRFAYAEDPAGSGLVRRLTPAGGAPRFLVE
jgi:hypothetical protein